LFGTTKQYAQLLLTTGEVVTVETYADYNAYEDHVVSYTISSDVYTLTDVSAMTLNSTADYLAITKGKANGLVNNVATVFSAATTFVVFDTTGTTPVYNTYTGIASVPSLVNNTTTTYTYVVDDDGQGNADSIADIVFILNATSPDTTSTNTYYIVHAASPTAITDADLGTYYEYAAIVNGEVTTVKSTVSTLAAAADALVSSVTTNSNGLVTALGSNVTGVTTGTGTVALSNGLLGVDSANTTKYYTVSSDFVAYKIALDGTISEVKASAITTDANDTLVYVVNNAGEISALYITVVA
jgi:hypothetical protein